MRWERGVPCFRVACSKALKRGTAFGHSNGCCCAVRWQPVVHLPIQTSKAAEAQAEVSLRGTLASASRCCFDNAGRSRAHRGPIAGDSRFREEIFLSRRPSFGGRRRAAGSTPKAHRGRASYLVPWYEACTSPFRGLRRSPDASLPPCALAGGLPSAQGPTAS